MIRLTKYTPYLEKDWDKLSNGITCNLTFKNEDELEIFRDCLEADYIDDAYGSCVRMMLEYEYYE